MKVSIIICTYNRAESLKETLASLVAQTEIDQIDCEIIVVDNNSTDNTKDLVDSQIKEHKGKMRYVFELEQGLSFARNRGIREAEGDIIVFTDDDVLVGEDWLFNLLICFKENDCVAVGGRVLPLYPDNTPKWVKENKKILSGPIVCHDHGEDTIGYGTKKMSPFIGANMAFKKECFDNYGLFKTYLGAGQIGTGEDSDYFHRLINKNIVYCGKAVVFHPVIPERISFNHFAKYYFVLGKFYGTKEAEKTNNDKPFVYYFGLPRYYLKVLFTTFILMSITFLNKKVFLKYFARFFISLGESVQYKASRKTFGI